MQLATIYLMSLFLAFGATAKTLPSLMWRTFVLFSLAFLLGPVPPPINFDRILWISIAFIGTVPPMFLGYYIKKLALFLHRQKLQAA